MAYSIDRMPERISIGRETETGVTDVMIDCGAWVDKWPGMALHAIHTPDGGTPYILQTETDGSVLVWHVTDADTATPGTGLVEIVGETDGRRKVSATVKVSVAARMSGTVGEPPEAAKPWADRVVEAAERITGMKAQAKTLDAGIGATAEWDGQQGLLTIGVPKGKDGKDAVVDATLTKSGQAADAKVTGDAVSQLKGDLADKLPKSPANWELWTAEEQAAARGRMGIGDYQLINDITLDEDVAELTITSEQDGNSYNLKKFIVIMSGLSETPGKSYFRIDAWTIETANLFVKYFNYDVKKYFFASYEAISPNLFRVDTGEQDINANIFTKGYSDICNTNYMGKPINDTNITKIHFMRSVSTDTLQAGTNIKIYGVRA